MESFLYIRRRLVDKISGGWMAVCLFVLLFLPLVIGLGLVIRSLPILKAYPLFQLLFSSAWSPMSGDFGFLPFIVSSLLVTVLSFLLAAPVSLLAAIYLTQYAPRRLMQIMYFVIDVLAGIPSVVYGVWGIVVIVPLCGDYLAPFFHISSSGYCLLAGGIVLAIMCIPYMLNMLIEVLRAVPDELKEASLSLGATYWETIKKVLLKKSGSGIIASMGLGVSKALGETIAVLMVVGNVAQIPNSVFDSAYPLPALIANNFGEMMSVPLYDGALMFAALILFVIIILFNALANLLIFKTLKE